MVVFSPSGCIRARWLYSRQVVVFGQGGCIGVKWLYWVKLVLIGKIDCSWAKDVFWGGKIGCIRKKWLHLGKSGSIRAKMVVFGQK